MRKELSEAVSGIGFARLSATRRKQIRYILLGSLGVHVLAFLILGGIVIAKYLSAEKTVFVTPPPAKKYEPRKVELKVKVQKRQRSSSRPAIVPRMLSMKPSDLSLPEIKVDPKLITTSFQPKFKAVSGKGLGVGTGRGFGADGFGDGMSAINFFGIQAKGERVAVCVDVSVSMVEPERGGVPGFMRVKERVNDVIEALRDGTQFNVIAFADACSVLEPKMVFANGETRKKAKAFLRPFNSGGGYGLDQGNFQASGGLPAAGGTTRLDLALTAAMQMGADTILIISDGLPIVKKQQDISQVQAQNNMINEWRTKNAGAIAAAQQAAAAWDQANAAAMAANPPVMKRVWIPPSPARPPSAAPLREGARPDPGAPAQPGRWEMQSSGGGHAGGHRPSIPGPPPLPPPGNWTLADFCRHIEILYEAVHKPQGLKKPTIHGIGYQIDRAGGDFLNQLASNYKGRYRLVRSMK